ncbi:MAG TPA: DNA mismatch repair protein MutS [Acidobacteriota bacterium]|nr:DNA mismatch repair protein MutS [Acidobacteriota bacterium]
MNVTTDRSPNPREEYERRLTVRQHAAALQDRRHRRIALLRLVVFAAAALMAWSSLTLSYPSLWWLTFPAVAFIVLMILQERARQARLRSEKAAAFYQRGLARVDGRWMGTGEQGDRFRDPSHPYAEDLDLFGKGSLFELICAARTRMGEGTLAAWFKGPASPREVRERQSAIEELRGRLDLREELAVLGTDIRAGVNPEALSNWAVAAPVLISRRTRILIALLAAGTVASLTAWGIFGEIRLWFLTMLLVDGIIALIFRRKVVQVLDHAEHPVEDLALLSQVLGLLERERFSSPLLARLRNELDSEGLPPSGQIGRLNRIIVLLDSGRNQLFAPLAALLLWKTQIAFAVEAWRRRSGPLVPRWLEAVGELEALCSLAGYSYEHPDDPFPEILEEGDGFVGEKLGHPLIPENRCVRNDVRLQGELQVLLVSGSNMSGKSTLLRTVGTNAVLALAGAPVRAASLRLTPLSVGASIRIMDSLQAGSSRFYAEITRLRQLVELTKEARPLLFLLDELLHGTNSHDRRIGAEAIVKGLADRRAIGLLTTHDLALAHIADVLSPRAANVHFEDHIENGEIAFDYLLRSGIVRRSNALELMRSVGLEV